MQNEFEQILTSEDISDADRHRLSVGPNRLLIERVLGGAVVLFAVAGYVYSQRPRFGGKAKKMRSSLIDSTNANALASPGEPTRLGLTIYDAVMTAERRVPSTSDDFLVRNRTLNGEEFGRAFRKKTSSHSGFSASIHRFIAHWLSSIS